MTNDIQSKDLIIKIRTYQQLMDKLINKAHDCEDTFLKDIYLKKAREYGIKIEELLNVYKQEDELSR